MPTQPNPDHLKQPGHVDSTGWTRLHPQQVITNPAPSDRLPSGLVLFRARTKRSGDPSYRRGGCVFTPNDQLFAVDFESFDEIMNHELEHPRLVVERVGVTP